MLTRPNKGLIFDKYYHTISDFPLGIPMKAEVFELNELRILLLILANLSQQHSNRIVDISRHYLQRTLAQQVAELFNFEITSPTLNPLSDAKEQVKCAHSQSLLSLLEQRKNAYLDSFKLAEGSEMSPALMMGLYEIIQDEVKANPQKAMDDYGALLGVSADNTLLYYHNIDDLSSQAADILEPEFSGKKPISGNIKSLCSLYMGYKHYCEQVQKYTFDDQPTRGLDRIYAFLEHFTAIVIIRNQQDFINTHTAVDTAVKVAQQAKPAEGYADAALLTMTAKLLGTSHLFAPPTATAAAVTASSLEEDLSRPNP